MFIVFEFVGMVCTLYTVLGREEPEHAWRAARSAVPTETNSSTSRARVCSGDRLNVCAFCALFVTVWGAIPSNCGAPRLYAKSSWNDMTFASSASF
eukprot:5070118-Amphidinium_carterae.1